MKRRIFDAMSRFFDSAWYPAVYAGVCVISGVNGKAVYVPMACVLAALIILSCFFAKNKRSFIAPVLMSFYCIGVDHQEGFSNSNAQLLGYYDMGGFMMIIAIGVVAAVFLFVRLFRLGVFAKENQGRSSFLWGILLMDAALLLNGIGSPHWQPVNLVYGLLFAGVLTFFYFLFRGCLTEEADREYICRITVLMSVIAFLQLLIVCIQRWQEGTLFLDIGGLPTQYLSRDIASLGWGIATSVGGILVLGVPAAMYLATRNRRGWLWCLLALALIGMSLIPRSRSSVISAIVFFVFGLAVGCFRGKNQKQLRIIAVTLVSATVGAGIAILLSVQLRVADLIAFVRIDKILEDNRWNMWVTAWEDLKSAPILGVGFEEGARLPEKRLGNVFSNMYHGIIPQFCGAMGLIGICAFGKHLFDLGKMLFRRFSAEKLLLFAVPGMILAMSIVDNFFFYANYQFAYCLFLALIEKVDEKRLT